MATILLSAAGYAAGSALGGSVLGLSTAVIGRAVGATVGRVIDERILGSGTDPVETGRVERFRLTGAGEGAPIGLVQGRMRVAGQIIWATRFEEHVRRSGGGGGKGRPRGPETLEHSYTVSLALALCEGEILRVGRVWADGEEVARESLGMRVYRGTADQLPDPKIEAVQGVAPAYRGTAYVVMEDLDLTPYGSRVPQFSFEVMRPAHANVFAETPDVPTALRAVCVVPGTGEYALATTPVHFDHGEGRTETANQNSVSLLTDFGASLDALREELPGVGSAGLVVSWFGDDLRCGHCHVQPKVEQGHRDGVGMPWRVCGLDRWSVGLVPQEESRPLYGGTPADAAVVEGIQAARARGLEVMFYPFILMEQTEGNALPDPWRGGAPGQPALPWRGRITTSLAPGAEGTPDGTAAAEAEVATFFGAAGPGDFSIQDGIVSYSGPQEWSYRRFILHYAHLCLAAGGVDAFCIGSEMRSLTQVRGDGASFPAVAQLIALAREVKAILGPGCAVSYAADWSEYFGYHPQDGSGDVFFHLDALWADPAVDFVGIDNYMPLSDWRDGDGHADAHWGTVHDLGYLRSGVEGGEGYDWFYDGPEAGERQDRTPIVDGAYGEDWVYRYKDVRGWWSNVHYHRQGGTRGNVPTEWVPGLKPVRFTEFGCAALDRGANQPNKFIDPKSSESAVARHSSGRRDETMQAQYLRAVTSYWNDPGRNPVSPVYGGPMIDMERAHAWCWDARPWPAFPLRRDLWSDGGNHARGHWLNGRTASVPLALAVKEICERSGVGDVDVSALRGTVTGYSMPGLLSGRAALQPLMLAHGFDAVESGGVLRFVMRGAPTVAGVIEGRTVAREDGAVEASRAPLAETPGRIRIVHAEGEGTYDATVSEAAFPGEDPEHAGGTELDMALSRQDARGIAERWLAEARIGRDTLRFSLPPSMSHLSAGDVIEVEGHDGRWRIERVEDADARALEAVRVEPSAYVHSDSVEDPPGLKRHVPPLPVRHLFLDLPLMSGDEIAHAPHVAVAADPWPGTVALFSAPGEEGPFAERMLVSRPSVIGTTLSELNAASPGRWDRGPALIVRTSDALAPASPEALLEGANLAAIGDGSPEGWELFQFAEAELVDAGVWALSMRLRGQVGSDADGSSWPAGSSFVLLDATVGQLDLAASSRGLVRHYRIGPGTRPWDDASYQASAHAFAGVGLRPLSPVHLRAVADGAGGLRVGWVRRSRIDADTWVGSVPLGEAQELYRVTVLAGGSLRREADVTSPEWLYGAAELSSDAALGEVTVMVSQISDRWGPGPAGVLTL